MNNYSHESRGRRGATTRRRSRVEDPLDESIFGAPVYEEEEPQSRRSDRNRRRRGQQRRRRRLVTYVTATAVLVVGGAVVVTNFKPLYEQLVESGDYEGEGGENVTVVVRPGDSGGQIAQRLQESGVVKTAAAFREALENNKGDEIQPGTYTLRKEMKATAALSNLRGGNRNVAKVTIREGLWKSETYDVLSKATGTPREEYDKAEKSAGADPSLLGLPASTKGNPEGWLFPATYNFDKKSPAMDQLKKLVGQTDMKLKALNVPSDQAHRVLTIASMVEAEARHVDDGPKVARVLENRLTAKPPMKLELDSTSMYGVQQRTGKALTSEQMRKANNPYNTYAIEGMPAGPIGNPGENAIKAAMNPASGSWLFFVTTNPSSGETIFTSTFAEHNVQVAKLNAWCRANPGKC
ncbi:endolytic transglycosylase MltG [Austwickia chelonae]|uniref:endolytic transglycosylase MltG n=1 Tax=Austwickia chelonae TaxID=100225 RepID=UPI001F0851E3|nr:endolytic transglycosylase MltG [Austwickia chelonae]